MDVCVPLCMHTNISRSGYGGQKTLREVILSFYQLGSANSAHQVQQEASSPPEPSCCLQNIETLNFQEAKSMHGSSGNY